MQRDRDHAKRDGQQRTERQEDERDDVHLRVGLLAQGEPKNNCRDDGHECHDHQAFAPMCTHATNIRYPLMAQRKSSTIRSAISTGVHGPLGLKESSRIRASHP